MTLKLIGQGTQLFKSLHVRIVGQVKVNQVRFNRKQTLSSQIIQFETFKQNKQSGTARNASVWHKTQSIHTHIAHA